MKIIDALNRLERAGAVNSAANKKLWQATIATADKVIGLVGCEATLPRNWRVQDEEGLNGYGLVLAYGRDFVQGPREAHLRPETSEELACQHQLALRLARDVASGWLEELVQMLERWSEESRVAEATLNP